MSGKAADFNYKVALASGLKSLQSGRLRQADEQFRYLIQHFPTSDGGYRGLAKVLVEQEDRPAALRVLLDGGASLAKAGERVGATALYREAITLDPHDLTAHRRLAAALSLAGDDDAAASEYARYVRGALDVNDQERARLEMTYALERMGDHAQIVELARSVGIDAPAHEPAAAAVEPAPDAHEDEHAALMRSASAAPPAEHASEAWAPAPSSNGSHPAAPVEMEPIAPGVDALTVEATAARYIAERDPRAAQASLEAARRYIAEGHVDAASDLLLHLIASGIAEHDAQRLLVDVARTLGKRDVAKAKIELLVQALRLDGHAELAAEVEQQAQAL